MRKTSIRKDMLSRRRHLAAETSMTWSLQAQERFLALPDFVEARCIALYSPILNEVFTEKIFVEARRLGKRVAYPRVREDALEFVAVADHRDLEPGAFGVLEPRSSGEAAPARIDLLAVPGLRASRYGVEIVIGEHARRSGWRRLDVPLEGVSQVMKEEKRGLLAGIGLRAGMYRDILRALLTRGGKDG